MRLHTIGIHSRLIDYVELTASQQAPNFIYYVCGHTCHVHIYTYVHVHVHAISTSVMMMMMDT